MVEKYKKSGRIHVLDDLRGIAILMVIFYHYFINLTLPNIPVHFDYTEYLVSFTNYFNLGSFAVSLFFLISGFVIPMSFKGDDKVKVIKRFAIKRFFRLYPTYWFAIICISVIILLFKDSNAYTFKQILINFTMMQDFFKEKSVDGVFWTLMIELKFYILSAILFYFGILKHIKYVMIFFLLLSVLTLFLGYIDGTKGYYNFTISRLLLMFLGTAFFYHHKRLLSKKELFLLTLAVIFYFSCNHFFLFDKVKFELFGYSVGTIVALFMFIIFINFDRPLSKVSTFFGNISYSLYLLHQVLGYFFIDVLLTLHTPLLLAQLVTFLLATFLASLTYKYVETKTNEFGHHYAKQVA